MSFSNLELAVTTGIAHLVLERPDRRNALSFELLAELHEALDQIDRNDTARVIVISGSGPDFSAGHDLSEMIDREPEFYDRLFTACTDVMLRIQTLAQPVIAQVHGTASAAGCQLVAACDLAIADEAARFATPGVKIGLFCSTPMVPLSRAVGRKRAMQMLLTGDAIDAATAREWGLINEVVARGEVAERVIAVAEQIMRFSPTVIGLGKRAFYDQVEMPDVEAYRTVTPIISGNAALPVAREGMHAFLEKRSPIWPHSGDR